MSLRMNLYGWSFDAFAKVLGSRNSAVLKAATRLLVETKMEEPDLGRGKAWLRTLINAGYPLRKDREGAKPPDDGGLLTMQMETGVHVAAIDCLRRAIAHDDYLDLASKSSGLIHPALHDLWGEFRACGFERAQYRGNDYFTRWVKMLDGTPLFGDRFETTTFYSCLSNDDLAEMVPIFKAAARFKRPFPKTLAEVPFAKLPKAQQEQWKKMYKTGLSESAKAAVKALTQWFTRIQRAGQDAFILWW